MLQKTKPRPSTEVSEGDIKRRLSNRTETLEKTLNLVRSVDSVLASQLELLKAHAFFLLTAIPTFTHLFRYTASCQRLQRRMLKKRK